MPSHLRFTVAAFLLALAACAGPPAPRETFHRLDIGPVSQHFATPPLPGVLEIDRVETEGVLAERAIAYQSGDGALQRYSYEFWSEAPGLMIQSTLTRSLRAADGAGTVVTPDLRVSPDWTLRAKLRRFEHRPAAGTVALRLEVAVIGTRNGTLLLLKDYDGEAAATADPASVGPAMERALAGVTARLIGDIGRLSPPPAARP